ncbi:hypothetical protein BDZ91DRAFT_847019 [Kalaharituber pfeilii]|nr:hypothetical protein BDZ91DRAFT_847019 [Kalaharituber pfeilii]
MSQPYSSLIPPHSSNPTSEPRRDPYRPPSPPPSPPHTTTAHAFSDPSKSTAVPRIPPTSDIDPVNPTPLTTSNAPTASHALATSAAKPQLREGEEVGAAQLVSPSTSNVIHNEADASADGTSDGMVDLGWYSPLEQVPEPLVGGVPNTTLWMLIRRFDKQIQHVRTVPTPTTEGSGVKGDLDLNVAKDEAFSPDRLRGNVERLYMTVVIGIITFVKHIARIRSWEDKRRTGAWCATYFVAWSLDLLAPLSLLLLILLIVYPPTRTILFSPAKPLSTTSATTGASKLPPTGVAPGSHDSLTGAPETQPGEAVEQEAHNFVSGFGAIAISSAAGKPHDDLGDPKREEKIPDPTAAATRAADIKDVVEGSEGVAKKATKRPVEEAMWEGARPVMQAVGSIADMWERIANALSPTPPFSRTTPYKLAGVLLPVFLASLVVTPYMVVKGATFFAGVTFYSQPYISRGLDYLNKHYPNWQEAISLENTLLKAVPTNAQLTLTLLRIAEANHAPLPPPTSSHLKVKAAEEHHEHAEAQAEAQPKPKLHPDHPQHEQNQPQSKLPQRALGALKSMTRTAVQTVLHTDHAKAKITHSLPARNRLGAVAEREKVGKAAKGPQEYAARYRGVKGAAVILDYYNVGEGDENVPTRNVGPVLHWRSEDGKQEWKIPVEDIMEIEKLGGFGWKGKMVVGWSLDTKEVVDAVRIVYKTPVRDLQGAIVGERLREEKLLTAVVGRQEMVNRLMSMGKQRWECC